MHSHARGIGVRTTTITGLAAASVLLGAVHVARGDCVADADHVRWLGGVNTQGYAVRVGLSGSRAFLAEEDGGFHVVDVSDPAVPRIEADLAGLGPIHDFVLTGDVGLVADGSGIHVLDLGDPLHPSIIGSVGTPAPVNDLAVGSGSTACAAGGSGMLVLDLSDPAAPRVAGSLLVGPRTRVAMSTDGSRAYLGSLASGLEVVDLSAPSAPRIIGNAVDAAGPGPFAIEGDLAYGEFLHSFQVIDLASDVTNPTIIGSVPMPFHAFDVVVSGGHAYVADGGGGLQVIDVTNPAEPERVGGVDTHGWATGIAFAEDRVFIADGDGGLQVIDATHTHSAPIVGNVAIQGSAYGIAAAPGHRVLIAAHDAGLQVLDLRDIDSPRLEGSVNTPGSAYRVASDGTWAYVADYLQGLQVVDVADPTLPRIVGTLDTDGVAYGVAAAAGVVYVADGGRGLLLVDVSAHAEPRAVARVDTPSWAHGVVVSDGRAYVADGTAGLVIIDLTRPQGPAIIGSADTPGAAYDVALAGMHAYVADGDAGLQVIDVADPARPRITGSTGSGFAFGVVVSGSTAYVADLESGLQVVDVANPASPRIVAGVDPSNEASGVVLLDGHVCVAARLTGLEVFAMRCDPGTPVLLTDLRAESVADGIRILWEPLEASFQGFYVERTEGAPGGSAYQRLNEAEVIAPEGPWEFLDRAVSPGVPYAYRLAAVTVGGSLQHYGPVTAEWLGPGSDAAGVIMDIAPNPATAGIAHIVLDLPRGARSGRLSIHDAAGREIRCLLDDRAGAGAEGTTGWIVWDGRDAGGGRAPAGVYFVRLATERGAGARRFVLLPAP